ncbi:MAG: prepilin-type N-terminal cleavage/methylation domain-containing protein [Planctomycetota bacterium]|nr:prepilin-type N-terminal cleavage/methylation domain-containing protein [Planctomycetota bacterium]
MTTAHYIITSRPRGQACRVVRGFTLLELLIAAALSSVLLGVAWHTLATHSRLYEKRNESTERSQLARAIRYQFLSDIDHLIRIPSAATLDTSTLDTSTLDTLPAPLAYGLRGDRHSLEIAILEPAWDRLDSETPGQADHKEARQPEQTRPTSPIRLVRYQFVGAPRGEDILPGSLSQVVADAIQQETKSDQPTVLTAEEHLLDEEFSDHNTSDSNASGPGLLREVHAEQPLDREQQPGQDSTADGLPLDARPPRAVTTQGTLADRPAASTVSSADVNVDHVPEIEHLEFRYFDGQRWHSRWDSSVSGKLPAAVEMSFELARSQPPVRPRESIQQPKRSGGKIARSSHQQTSPRSPFSTLDSPPQDMGAVFRSLAVLRAPPRPTPPTAGIEVEP